MREYLLRGGFLMVDDFHGEYEWQNFVEGMRTIFPERPVEDIPADDPIYTLAYEIGERLQYPDRATWGRACSMSGRME